MNSIIRTQIQSYLIEYLQKKMPNFEVKGKMMRCPFEDRHMEKKDTLTMNEYPVNSGKLFCFDPACGKLGDIFKMCRHFDFCDNEDVEDEDIAQFLIKEFNIQTQNEIEGLLAKYSNWGWDLVPVSRNDKASNIELSWQNKSHKSLSEWRQWLQSNLNFGMKTGKMSNTICIDFDLVESKLKKRIYEGNPTENQVKEAKEQHEAKLKLLKEKLTFIDWSTVNQTSFGGVHLFYIDDKEIPSTSFEWEGIHIDILADGKQVVIEPSVVGGYQRKVIGEEIKVIPQEFKEFILSNCKKEVKEEQVKIESTEPDLNSVDLTFENLNNNRNNTFIKLAGELRRKMTIDQTGYAVYLFNQLLDRKLPQKELNAMLRQAEKYHEADLSLIESKVIEHLKIVETAHIRDLKECLGFERKDLEQALKCLCDHKKLYKVKKDLYKLIQATEWQTDFMSIGKPIDFKIPFFNDYAHFDDGAMIVIGGSSGTGKCLANGLLNTSSGLIDISDLGKNQPNGMSKIPGVRIFSGVANEKVYRKSNYFWKEKVNHTIKIQTDYGYELEGTPEHPILVVNSNNEKIFKKLKDLNINDRALLCIPKLFISKNKYKKLNEKIQHKNTYNIKKWSVCRELNNDIAKLFGYILGDGHAEKSCIRIYQNIKDTNCVIEIEKICQRLKLNYKTIIENNMKVVCIYSTDFIYFAKIKLFDINHRKNQINIKSPFRKIPKCILKSTKEIQIAFIEALFNCESSINKTKRGASLEITMSSKKLIDILQLMLLNLGIIARKTSKKVKKYKTNTYWRLYISEEMTFKFFQILNPVKYKEIKVEGFFKSTVNINWVGNNQFIKDIQFTDKIIKIENDYKEKYVYDFNMDSSKYKLKNRFWSNGFISHNTHISMNFVKQFVEQELRPNLITTEAGSKFGKIAQCLGLKEGDFVYKITNDPTLVPLESNAITIVDWLKPIDGDYAKTDVLYEHFNNQLVEKGGLLIIFAQLKKENHKFYAEDMVNFYASLVAKIIYPSVNGVLDNLNPYFKTEKIRDSKVGKQYLDILLTYSPEDKRVRLK